MDPDARNTVWTPSELDMHFHHAHDLVLSPSGPCCGLATKLGNSQSVPTATLTQCLPLKPLLLADDSCVRLTTCTMHNKSCVALCTLLCMSVHLAVQHSPITAEQQQQQHHATYRWM